MPDWGWWLIVAAVLGIGEVATLGFFLGPVAIAAGLAAIVAAAGGAIGLQVGVFIVASVASLAIIRPIARRHLRTPGQIRTGAAALVGTRATVLERVDAHSGQVKIGGEVWSARAFMDGQVIEPGTRVEVAKIEGATALVYE